MKLKTKSSAKKRFSLTGSGKLVRGQAGKRHGMRKRSSNMKRVARGSTVAHAADAKFVKKVFMPYGAS